MREKKRYKRKKGGGSIKRKKRGTEPSLKYQKALPTGREKKKSIT